MQSDRPDTTLSLELYRMVRRIRTFEERVGELFVRQQSAGSMLHLSIGEEAAAAGVGRTMVDGDTFTTHHRGHGIFLARGADPNRMMAEIAGKEAGYCRGKGGSMHIADHGLGHLGANAIVGGGIPAVVGAGLSYRRAQQPNVSFAFFGDGAMQQGVLYESMNMAALWKLPVIFVCVNNQWGMGTRVDQSASTIKFEERARGFNLASHSVDGRDVRAVHRIAQELVDNARQGQPAFLTVECYRFHGHARMDKSPYRTAEEETLGRQSDPLKHLGEAMLEEGAATQADLDRIQQEATQEMDAALEFAVQAPRPPLKSMFRDVYADDEPAPEPLRERVAAILADQE